MPKRYVGWSVVVLGLLAGSARADRLFHTVRVPFAPVNGFPELKSGETIHTHTESPGDSNVIQAFHLSGGPASTAFSVIAILRPGGCAGFPLPFEIMSIATDAYGDANDRLTASKAVEDLLVAIFGTAHWGVEYRLSVGALAIDPATSLVLNYDPGDDAYRAACFEEVKGDPSHDP